MQPMPEDEYLELLNGLQNYHGIFYSFWKIGKPYFVDNERTPTAAVIFTHEGQILHIEINKVYWNTLTSLQRHFVISHENIHIIFDHCSRILPLKNKKRANIAADLVTNHTLVNSFNFSRMLVDPDNRYCWVDKYFDASVDDDLSLEQYYALLSKIPDDKLDAIGGTLVDDHSPPIGKSENKAIKGQIESNMREADKGTLNDILKDIEDSKAGSGKGSHTWKFDFKPPPKKKWETLIKIWEKKTIGMTEVYESDWIKDNRRNSMIINRDIFLPNYNIYEKKKEKKDKIEVFFFLDLSGSCKQYAEKFYKVSQSLDVKKFNVRLFTFDTEVFEVGDDRVLYGGGGTRFDIMEIKIQEIMKDEHIKYPHGVFIITDGAGNTVRPEHPENWHWFLTDEKVKHYIPEKSKSYNLKDYE